MFDPDPVPWNPNVVEPLALTRPFHAALRAVTVRDVPAATAFQAFVIVLPDGTVMVTAQPLIAWLPAVTVTSPTNPPGQLLATR